MGDHDARDLKYWVSFARLPRVGRVRMTLLERHFGRLADAWQANAGDLRAAGLD